MLTQYEVNHMENLMVRNDYWNDDADEWEEEEVFEDDDIDEL